MSLWFVHEHRYRSTKSGQVLPVSASGVWNPTAPQRFGKNILMNDAATADDAGRLHTPPRGVMSR